MRWDESLATFGRLSWARLTNYSYNLIATTATTTKKKKKSEGLKVFVFGFLSSTLGTFRHLSSVKFSTSKISKGKSSGGSFRCGQMEKVRTAPIAISMGAQKLNVGFLLMSDATCFLYHANMRWMPTLLGEIIVRSPRSNFAWGPLGYS